ncbi:hypothetical protein [Roseicella aquatilis]|uniref:Uncharacterized protein n=1 Tax=Roseicella aquatilis TaxID=2527868 RepID=A0A4R4DKX4_9PROT|nr:hypothetical protein [Roseicella aquatilis]TCZ61142.1 hypothetical protein EXY23_13515 [Roseicella aquatilis]
MAGVRTIKAGEWVAGLGGGLETRLSFGASDKEFFYALEQATPSHESGGRWIGPFPTRAAAEGAGLGAERRAHGEDRHGGPRDTLRAEHARRLASVAEVRRGVARARQDGRHGSTASSLVYAKSSIDQARQMRESNKEGMQMAIGDPKEVRQARQEVRRKEAAVWNDRTEAGRTAMRAEAVEKARAGGGEDPDRKQRQSGRQGVSG